MNDESANERKRVKVMIWGGGEFPNLIQSHSKSDNHVSRLHGIYIHIYTYTYT